MCQGFYCIESVLFQFAIFDRLQSWMSAILMMSLPRKTQSSRLQRTVDHCRQESKYVCVHVLMCVHMCTNVCAHVFLCVRVCALVSVCFCVHVFVCLHVGLHVRTYVCV